jgi:hypothetical protein
MFPSLPASAIADALVKAGGDMRLAVDRLLAAQVTRWYSGCSLSII